MNEHLNRRQVLRLMGGTAALAASGLLPSLALARDPFAEFDRMEQEAFASFDAQTKQAFDDLNRRTQQAFARAGAQVASTWGDKEVLLPAPKQWVGYDESQGGRIAANYQTGTVKVEVEAPPDVSPQELRNRLAAFSAKALTLPSAQLDKLDPVRQDIIASSYAPAAPKAESKEVQQAKSLQHLLDTKTLTPVRLERQIEQGEDVTIRQSSTSQGQKTIASITIPMKKDHEKLSAQAVYPFAKDFGARFKMPVNLVLAVTFVESSFNPRAVSPIPAYGLMQLVPASGALDAYLFVYGEKKILDTDYLFEPDRNVELGAAYLHLLYYRYLKNVGNPESRLYCAIAGYNTGAGNVAKAFGTNLGGLAAKTARYTPQQILNKLKKDLPYAETRRYVDKVTRAMETYKNFQG
ncbi:MAG: transglycosylase SLT domain-containing protein [Desulfovibrionaceae bacterium]